MSRLISYATLDLAGTVEVPRLVLLRAFQKAWSEYHDKHPMDEYDEFECWAELEALLPYIGVEETR